MKSVSIRRYGGPEVLEVLDVPDAVPGPGEVSISVTHATVGLVEIMIRRGDFADVEGVAKPPFVPGLEVAGTIRALGPGVSGFQVGERVASLTLPKQGGYAEVTVAPADLVVRLEPSGADSAQAVAALANAATAYLALTEAAHIRPGARVLVHGVMGGLASAFPAVARSLGASRIVGTERPEKSSAACKLDLDRVVAGGEFPSALAGEQFDVVVDPVGGEMRLKSLPLVAMEGRLLAVGNASGAAGAQVDTSALWRRSIGVVGYAVGHVLAIHPERGPAAAAAVLPLIAAGKLELPVVTLPLDRAGEAQQRMETGSVLGRLLLTP